MSTFEPDTNLEIGSVFEVAGTAIKVALSRDISELTRSHRGRVYDVGQIGSLVKMHLGRRLIFATVRLLRLQTDEESAALTGKVDTVSREKRVIEADLLAEAWFNHEEEKLTFSRGVATYPLPLQSVYLVTRTETELLFESAENSSSSRNSVCVNIGSYVGATRVPCRANLDKMFGQHCAVLGSTGSGKSSAVCAILHAITDNSPEKRPTKPNVILIDPHGEYGNAFRTTAQRYQAYNALGHAEVDAKTLSLPYWLMSGDEFRSLVIGKTEFEATSQSNTVYKALRHARMVSAGLVQSAEGPIPDDLPDGAHPEDPMPLPGVDVGQITAFDRDKPRPFKLSEFYSHIVNRQALKRSGTGWSSLPPGEFQKEYGSILNKFRVLRSDPRLKFLMKDHEEEDPPLSVVISQFLRLNSEDQKGIKIIDISGLPNEVAGPLTGAIARLMFQYKLHQTRGERENDPILFVCEEAHRYVPNRGDAQYEVAQTAIRRIAREGRKYGLGLMLVSQRPSDVEGTVISQCNSWIVLRLTNSSDQEHVSKFLPDSLVGMTRTLSSLPRQHALFVGEAAAIPARIKLHTLREDQLPGSNDVSFVAGWTSDGTSKASLNRISERMTKS